MSRVAAIDCGTNSIRILVADVTGSSDGTPALRDIYREQRVVRLGQGVDATGVLDPAALERTRAALADYTAVLRRTGTERVRMVATSATRDARTRDDFFGMVRATLGVDAEIISGDEEARLAFAGAVGELDPGDGPFVVSDVGGGSTELVVGELTADGAMVGAARSVDIGSVRITERCLHGDPPSADEIAKARELAAEVLDDAFAVVPVEGVHNWVGVAGTITTLSAYAQRMRTYDPAAVHLSRLSVEDLRRVADELLGMTREQRSEHKAIDPGRIDVIGGGALIVEMLGAQLRARAGVGELVISEHDILDGIARTLAVA